MKFQNNPPMIEPAKLMNILPAVDEDSPDSQSMIVQTQMNIIDSKQGTLQKEFNNTNTILKIDTKENMVSKMNETYLS